ncbi:MAG: CPBP family intramembrane metalloprotease [Ignavibacteriales bacterium]|nr:CPBP family intramembrane metalloprotease [Ignavibacteriales bacterium]
MTPQQFLRLRVPDPRTLLVALVGIVSLQQMMQVYLVFQDKIQFPEPIQSQLDKLKDLIEGIYKTLVSSSSVSELVGVIVIIALIPAISEELFFRGLVQRNFEKGLTPIRGVMLTGIIFGAYHLNPFAFVPLAVLGMYLGFLTMRADSIWVSIAAHFYNNLFACLALYFQVKDDYVVMGNANEMSLGGLLFTFWLFGVVFLISTYYFIKITAPPRAESIVHS